MVPVKPFLLIDEQIELLKKRKLNISDDQYKKAKEFLLNNNYYRVSGYSLTLRQNDIFFDGVSFEALIQIYEADRHMRHALLSLIEVVEVRIKSMIAYFHSKKYGPLGYLDINNFCCTDNKKINLSIIKNYLHITRKANIQKNKMTESELFLKHHKENRKNILPFWVYVEVLTISDASKLYTILDEEIRKTIAQHFGFKSNNRHKILENLLHCITRFHCTNLDFEAGKFEQLT